MTTNTLQANVEAEQAITRAQLYAFLAPIYLYPRDNWSEDIPLAREIAARLSFAPAFPSVEPVELDLLQSEYRKAFGAAGSLAYETEYGLPHEYRQAQELADLNGFYHAFGFALGGEQAQAQLSTGTVRERPDHIAVELEFMHLLALKEAHAAATGTVEHRELCAEAQAKFLGEHLGIWVELFAQSLALNTQSRVYLALANFTTAFVYADAGRLGVSVTPRNRQDMQHTPFDPDFSCTACPVAELAR
jgi:putative dimethyl sulfoxide reductase chaperone